MECGKGRAPTSVPRGAVRTLTPGRAPMLQSRWRQSTQAPPPKAPPWGRGGLGRALIQGRHGSALRQCNHDAMDSALGRESQGEVPTGRCLAPGERTAVQQSEGQRNRSLFDLGGDHRDGMLACPAHARTSSTDKNGKGSTCLVLWARARSCHGPAPRPNHLGGPSHLGCTRKHSGRGTQKQTSSNHHTHDLSNGVQSHSSYTQHAAKSSRRQ